MTDLKVTAGRLVQQWYEHSGFRTQMLGEDGNRLRAAIAAALQAEREECAKVAEDYKNRFFDSSGGSYICRDIAAAIRARGDA